MDSERGEREVGAGSACERVQIAPATLAALVRRAQAGDRDAFDRLAAHYRPLLFAVAFLRTADRHEAEDLAQEALAQAWRRLPTLAEPAAFPAWARAIAANACNGWGRTDRQRRLNTRSWEEAAPAVAADPAAMPLPLLLSRERQRELRAALLALPEANRIALLLHVWGGYAYAEIASLTAVRASTVEGRIYRAKRQLRAALHDGGAIFMSEPCRPWGAGDIPRDLADRRTETTMTTTPPKTPKRTPTPSQPADDLPLACVVFADRFSRLIDSGVSLVRTLRALEATMGAYGPTAGHLAARLEIGEILSAAMKEHGELFSPFYVALVRAGEVGGVLEETLQRARRTMTREWELARRRPPEEAPLYFTLPSGAALPDDWRGLTEYQRLVIQVLFCETFGMLLASGVPILQTMGIVAELLPAAQREGMERARQAVRGGTPPRAALELVGVFPPFVLEFVDIGAVSGSLDTALYAAAETIEHELNCRFPA